MNVYEQNRAKMANILTLAIYVENAKFFTGILPIAFRQLFRHTAADLALFRPDAFMPLYIRKH